MAVALLMLLGVSLASAATMSVPWGFAASGVRTTANTGDTINWILTLDQGVTHTVTSRNVTTSGSVLFDSGRVTAGGAFSWTFNAPGVYTYYCTIHPSLAGTVVVLPLDTTPTMPSTNSSSSPITKPSTTTGSTSSSSCPCLNGGVCSGNFGNGTTLQCQCVYGFSGQYCQVPPNSTVTTPSTGSSSSTQGSSSTTKASPSTSPSTFTLPTMSTTTTINPNAPYVLWGVNAGTIPTVNITIGAVVTWYVTDGLNHTVTSGNLTDGGKPLFDSGPLHATTSGSLTPPVYQYQFNATGLYPYFDRFNTSLIGLVNVTLPPYGTTTSTVATSSTASSTTSSTTTSTTSSTTIIDTTPTPPTHPTMPATNSSSSPITKPSTTTGSTSSSSCPCLNSGICIVVAGTSSLCRCVNGFSGQYCQVPPNSTVATPSTGSSSSTQGSSSTTKASPSTSPSTFTPPPMSTTTTINPNAPYVLWGVNAGTIPTVNITIGVVVTWYVTDGLNHTVTSGNLTDGGKPLFDSGPLHATTSGSLTPPVYQYQFNATGLYPYFDRFNTSLIGLVNVTLPPYGTTTSTVATSSTASSTTTSTTTSTASSTTISDTTPTSSTTSTASSTVSSTTISDTTPTSSTPATTATSSSATSSAPTTATTSKTTTTTAAATISSTTATTALSTATTTTSTSTAAITSTAAASSLTAVGAGVGAGVGGLLLGFETTFLGAAIIRCRILLLVVWFLRRRRAGAKKENAAEKAEPTALKAKADHAAYAFVLPDARERSGSD